MGTKRLSMDTKRLVSKIYHWESNCRVFDQIYPKCIDCNTWCEKIHIVTFPLLQRPPCCNATHQHWTLVTVWYVKWNQSKLNYWVVRALSIFYKKKLTTFHGWIDFYKSCTVCGHKHLICIDGRAAYDCLHFNQYTISHINEVFSFHSPLNKSNA